MKIYPYIILLLTTSVGLVSCEKEATIDPPKTNPKLVIASFISPQDTLIRVRVTMSLPIFGTVSDSVHYGKAVTNASVILSDGNSSVTLNYDKTQASYVVKTTLFKIEAGKTYHLDVSSTDGLKIAAECTVPELNNTLTLEEIDSVFSNEKKTYKVTLKWEDDPLTSNNYRLVGEGKVVYKSTKISSYQTGLILDEKDRFISDIQASSSTFTRKGSFEIWNNQDHYLKKTSLHLLNLDAHYYKYHKSLENYSGDNPFAEPTLLYSNIQGGLGVFCSYNKSTVINDL